MTTIITKSRIVKKTTTKFASPIPIVKTAGGVLNAEQMFSQSNGDVKAKLVPSKEYKTVLCVSQNGDYVLLTPETMKAILEWHNA
jgi:hypothetical protein